MLSLKIYVNVPTVRKKQKKLQNTVSNQCCVYGFDEYQINWPSGSGSERNIYGVSNTSSNQWKHILQRNVYAINVLFI